MAINSTAKQVTQPSKNAIGRQNAGTATNNSDDSKTSADTNARPWATTVVFKSDGDNSESTDQYIWNHGEGIEETDNNIYLKQNSSGELYFGWGKNSDKNELALGITVNTTDWYGVYIAHKGGRFDASNATASNLADAFDIRVMSSADEFEALSTNLSTLPIGVRQQVPLVSTMMMHL